MTSLLIKAEPVNLKVDLASLTGSLPMTEEQFYQLCLNNPELRIERSALGEITIMPPLFQTLEIVISKSPNRLETGQMKMGREKSLIQVRGLHCPMVQPDRPTPPGF